MPGRYARGGVRAEGDEERGRDRNGGEQERHEKTGRIRPDAVPLRWHGFTWTHVLYVNPLLQIDRAEAANG